jgi:hypothetical protein
MGFGLGASRSLRYKKQTGLAVVATNTGGQVLRRNTATPKFERATIASGEMRPDYQMAASRLGVRNVGMAYACDVVPGVQKDLIASFVRGAFSAAITTGAQINITAAATAPHFSRAAGSFLTDGFKVGDVISATGFAAPATGNNSRNLVITAVTALTMSVIAQDLLPIIARAAGDSVTIALRGKRVSTPSTGHVRDYYTVEDWQPDVPSSIVYTDMRVGTLNLQSDATGMATISMDFVGRDAVAPSATVYFASPTAAPAGAGAIGVTGVVISGGAAIGYITSASVSCNGNMSTEAVLGSQLTPDVFDGQIAVTGSFTALKADDTFHTAVRNESRIQLVLMFTSGSGSLADFVAVNLQSCVVLGQSVDDNPKALKQTVNFECPFFEAAGVDGIATTVIFQDSLA